MTTQTIAIPLNKLVAWEGNVRKTESDKDIDELAASIKAHGLLQSLVVRKDKGDKFAVVAGRRRLMALQSLAENGDIGTGNHIQCHIISDDADATEISLTENVVREQMHPADEFEAFKKLADSGTPLADIAARFGVTETVVQKRLKLANVSPKLIEAYRKGEMTMQHMTAFAVTSDHALQEKVWKEIPQWQRDDYDGIRATLIDDEIDATDRRVQFVTLKAYEKAGGAVRRDLFSEGDEGIFIADPLLLTSLIAQKLEKLSEDVRKEGWKWVEIVASSNDIDTSTLGRRRPETAPLSDKDQKQLDKLQKEYSDLIDSDDEADQDRAYELQDQIADLEESGGEVWPPETLAIAGAIVTIGYQGNPEIQRGFVRPEDGPKKEAVKKTNTGKGDKKDDSGGMSAALIESLTTQRTAALAATLKDNSSVALTAVVHALAEDTFYVGMSHTCVQIRASEPALKDIDKAKATLDTNKASAEWKKKLPKKAEALWEWCLKQKQPLLLDLLAFCVANTVNAIDAKHNSEPRRLKHADELAKAVKLDMSEWFAPTAENYFNRIGKASILADLKDAKVTVTPAMQKASKGDLAIIAEREIKKTGWLPKLLRKPK